MFNTVNQNATKILGKIVFINNFTDYLHDMPVVGINFYLSVHAMISDLTKVIYKKCSHIYEAKRVSIIIFLP